MLTTLVAVLIGGGMTLATQLILEWAKGRKDTRIAQMQRQAMVRLLEDYFWVASVLIHEALVEDAWWDVDKDPLWYPVQEDFSRIVEILDPTEVGIVLAADRRFRGLLKQRTAPPTPCSSDRSVRWLTGALLLSEHCRLALLARRGVTGRQSMDFNSVPLPINEVKGIASLLLPPASQLQDPALEGIRVWH